MKRIVPMITRVSTGKVPDVIKLLEDWLNDARRGDLVALMLVGVTADYEVVWQRCDNGRWAVLLAGSASAHHDMLSEGEQP